MPTIDKAEVLKSLAGKAAEVAGSTLSGSGLGAKVGAFDKFMQVANNPLVMKYIDRIFSRIPFLAPLPSEGGSQIMPQEVQIDTGKGQMARKQDSAVKPQIQQIKGSEIVSMMAEFVGLVEDKKMTVEEFQAYLIQNQVGLAKLIDIGIAKLAK